MRSSTVLDITFYRTTNDINGNPRYIVHFLDFLKEDEFPGLDILSQFQIAHKRAKEIGFSKYRGKDFGGGFVCQSYNLNETAKRILEVRGE